MKLSYHTVDSGRHILATYKDANLKKYTGLNAHYIKNVHSFSLLSDALFRQKNKVTLIVVFTLQHTRVHWQEQQLYHVANMSCSSRCFCNFMAYLAAVTFNKGVHPTIWEQHLMWLKWNIQTRSNFEKIISINSS